MTIYQTVDVWTQIREAKEIPAKALTYFQARLKNRLHELVLLEFMKLEKLGFTKADMARRVRKKPEQITRLLGAPGNWTLDTVSDLLLAMGYELSLQVKSFDQADSHAVTSSEWPTKGNVIEFRPSPATTTSGDAAKPKAAAGN